MAVMVKYATSMFHNPLSVEVAYFSYQIFFDKAFLQTHFEEIGKVLPSKIYIIEL